ncbi:unnamed protein product [Arctogadus glacialis]
MTIAMSGVDETTDTTITGHHPVEPASHGAGKIHSLRSLQWAGGGGMARTTRKRRTTKKQRSTSGSSGDGGDGQQCPGQTQDEELNEDLADRSA